MCLCTYEKLQKYYTVMYVLNTHYANESRETNYKRQAIKKKDSDLILKQQSVFISE